MDFVLKGQGPLRCAALNKAYGDVLEVGFGTGLNLPYYPSAVRRLCALDVASLLPDRVEERIRQVRFPVDNVEVSSSERFPLEDRHFDCVVTTWTLCSVSDTSRLLSEIRRVLRSDGSYIFLEHGRAPSPHIARLQGKLSKVSKVLANGCKLDLPINEIIQQSGYRIVELKQFDKGRINSLTAHMFQGIATPIL
jgi:ubiquinone/menaquinone biosynthesis C-methylase UbiE